ncbi:hypothetical protein QNH20_16365 [Neobacillus sp. WH10]|uniref:hypothetical protein n=1 Tax=Neobacillus sp. WH10 TaxID=3047873 RepID=UPI0024C1D26C|nr:hypothetical protein [Neobacillus sp. WH10]WHY75695.1 hypothetical protein QNH20_16365 [Neobacillus sp. WH10]
MNYNTIIIEIHYSAASRGYKKGAFQLRGRKPEYVALQFWKQINKELSYRAELEKVIVEGDQDITQLVKELEIEEWNKSMNDNLPF